MKILFQGDSITDAGRNYEDKHDLGPGYPKYAAEIIAKNHPDADFEFVNLGIGGNKTDDLIARLDSDFIAEQPDYLSILVGVNDCWHFAEKRNFRHVSVFERNYRKILTEIKQKTSAKIMLVEPFLLPVKDKAFWRYKVDEEIVAVGIRLCALPYGRAARGGILRQKSFGVFRGRGSSAEKTGRGHGKNLRRILRKAALICQ